MDQRDYLNNGLMMIEHAVAHVLQMKLRNGL